LWIKLGIQLQGILVNASQIGYTWTLHNQMEATKIGQELRDKAEKPENLAEISTVDDSAIVKTITFVSAIYLLGSFVSVS
jgi:hypothetical protein